MKEGGGGGIHDASDLSGMDESVSGPGLVQKGLNRKGMSTIWEVWGYGGYEGELNNVHEYQELYVVDRMKWKFVSPLIHAHLFQVVLENGNVSRNDAYIAWSMCLRSR